jgi:hypothetical protein
VDSQISLAQSSIDQDLRLECLEACQIRVYQKGNFTIEVQDRHHVRIINKAGDNTFHFGRSIKYGLTKGYPPPNGQGAITLRHDHPKTGHMELPGQGAGHFSCPSNDDEYLL